MNDFFTDIIDIIRNILPDNESLSNSLDILPDDITRLAIGACLVLFVISWFSDKMRDIAPGLMVSAGIIGTFWGTFIALSGFHAVPNVDGDVNYRDIVNQIPIVLQGMTSAFTTSLVGLLSAFFSRILFRYLKSTPEVLPIEEEGRDLLRQIKEGITGESDKSLSSQLGVLRTEYRDGINVLKQGISGENESSMVTQLIKLRTDNNEGFNKLDGRLDGLADAIRNSLVENLESLMKELREVIVNQLSEQLRRTNDLLHTQLREMLDRIEEALIKQFGKTFTQFNEATQAIKKWQEDHRRQVEQLTEAFATTATGIERIRTDCESIPVAMNELKTLMGELDIRLQAFADMKNRAEQFFPTIKSYFDAIGGDLQKSADGFAGLEKTITTTYEQAGSLAQTHIEMAKQHIDNVGTQIDNTANTVAEASRGMIAKTESAHQQYEKSLDDMKKALGVHTDSTVNIVTEASRGMIAKTESAHQQYEQSLEEMKKALGKHTQECIEDLRARLVEMGETHAQTTIEEMNSIARSWGNNMVSIAEDASRRANARQISDNE